MIMLLGLMGCLNFDAFVFNGVHCSTVPADGCVGDGPWDSLCAACDEPLDWDTPFPFREDFPSMLAEGEDIRGIVPAGVERTVIPSTDGLAEIDTYWIPSHGENAAVANTTIFYNHGNYGGVEHYRGRLRVLHELGYNVFVWDFRGFGKSNPATHPTPDEFLADARQMRTAVNALAPDPSQVVVYGYSLGAIPAIEASVAEPGCALVLEAPFTSFSATSEQNTRANVPDTYLSSGAFDNVRKVADYAGPLFAFVGEEDGRFPPDGVREIVDNAPGTTEFWVLPGVEHGISDGGVVEAGMAAYAERIEAFLGANTDCL